MYKSIKSYCNNLLTQFENIPVDRKELLEKIAQYITKKHKENRVANLIYICTHNSRRSHFGQVWADVAASYYRVNNVHAFSGGTETTAFNINAINALKRIGFTIETDNSEQNPVYQVFFGEESKPIICFFKSF